MTAYERKLIIMREKSRIREEKAKQEFLSKVDQVIINRDGWNSFIKKLIETKKGYTDYTIIIHQTGVYSYHVTFYDKHRYITRSSEYYFSEIPATHKAQFESLEQMF